LSLPGNDGDSLAMDRSLPLSNLDAFSVGQGMCRYIANRE